MCNCNQQRASYSLENDQSKKGMVKVILINDHPRVVNGDVTGRMYVFRKYNDVNWVDKRDAVSMKNIRGLQVTY